MAAAGADAILLPKVESGYGPPRLRRAGYRRRPNLRSGA